MTKRILFFLCVILSIHSATSCNVLNIEGTIAEQTTTFDAPTINEAIDLGLSVMWAPYNVGASKPSDYGNYYAWGEIEPKTEYSSETYHGPAGFFGSVDTFGTEYDVAYVKWGHEWRIPTMEELIEIQEKCQWEPAEQDGVNGMKVTGPNGNSIFFPAAGRCVGKRCEDVGESGHYWQGCANQEASEKDNYIYYDLNSIYNGLTIRPVLGVCNFSIIDEDNLNGWDFGLTNGEKYIVFKTNTDGTTTACVSSHFCQRYSYILDVDNESQRIVGFGTEETYYPVKETDEEYLLYYWHNGGFEVISVPKDNEIQAVKSYVQTKNPLVVAGVILISYQALKTLYKTSVDLHEGRWDDFFNDLGVATYGAITGKMLDAANMTPAGLLVDLTNELANQQKERIDRRITQEIYGDSSIRITGINKQKDGTYLVHAEVDGISSIQSDITVVSDSYYGEHKNHIFAGVLCRKFYSAFINHYTCRSFEMEITDGNTNKKFITFVLPELDKGKYYIKPYLRSSVNDVLSTIGNSYIRYGEQEEMTVVGGKVYDFEQVDACCIGNANVSIVFFAKAEVDSNEGLEDWGVYVKRDGDYLRFPSSWPKEKTKDNVRVELTFSRDEFDYVDYNSYTASKTITLGIYLKRNNSQGVYDYLTYEYGEPSEFVLTYDKPIRFSISNVMVTGIEPYSDSDGRDRLCRYEYTIEADGCLFFDSIINQSGSNWDSSFQYTLAEWCKDDYKQSFNSSYAYFSEGTKPGIIYFAAILGNGVYHQFATSLICDNGSVYTGDGEVVSSAANKKTMSHSKGELLLSKHLEER